MAQPLSIFGHRGSVAPVWAIMARQHHYQWNSVCYFIRFNWEHTTNQFSQCETKQPHFNVPLMRFLVHSMLQFNRVISSFFIIHIDLRIEFQCYSVHKNFSCTPLVKRTPSHSLRNGGRTWTIERKSWMEFFAMTSHSHCFSYRNCGNTLTTYVYNFSVAAVAAPSSSSSPLSVSCPLYFVRVPMHGSRIGSATIVLR